jgi:hypothetical protein
MEGLYKIKPAIKRIGFVERGKFKIELKDGRTILVPLGYFPSIKKLRKSERDKWYIIDDQMFSFEASDEVFHIEQVLGKENEYKFICK